MFFNRALPTSFNLCEYVVQNLILMFFSIMLFMHGKKYEHAFAGSLFNNCIQCTPKTKTSVTPLFNPRNHDTVCVCSLKQQRYVNKWAFHLHYKKTTFMYFGGRNTPGIPAEWSGASCMARLTGPVAVYNTARTAPPRSSRHLMNEHTQSGAEDDR